MQVRQANGPVGFQQSRRKDTGVLMSSGRAGKVIPVAYMPVLRGDSASGRMAVDIQLAEMPRPLLNGVSANLQAWFIPKSVHPRFGSVAEMNHSYTGEQIATLGASPRTPPAFFEMRSGADIATMEGSDFFRTLGLHLGGKAIHTDIVDAFVLAYNFRLAAHSSKLALKDYCATNLANALALPRAFWPTGRLNRIVPDYERALIVGALDLDVQAGKVPVYGIGAQNPPTNAPVNMTVRGPLGGSTTQTISGAGVAGWAEASPSVGTNRFGIAMNALSGNPYAIFADMEGETVQVTLADIDKARTTQAFAKLRKAYAGNETTGYSNDDMLLALLMQGIRIDADEFRRPMLLDSKRVAFGFSERFATDAANLDASVSQGVASATLGINVPKSDTGGTIVVTMEVLPERIFERLEDPWLHMSTVDELPNALRDVQRTEPVDTVSQGRIDARHANPALLYGYEPMNDKWNREFTRLGGAFYQSNPADPWTEQRSAIWHPAIVNPTFSADHWLAPANFPHTVFADSTAPAFEFVARHDLTIVGNTQIGDVLAEDNNDYAAIEAGGLEE